MAKWFRQSMILVGLGVILIVCISCGSEGKKQQESVILDVHKALATVGLTKEALSVPKLGRPYSTPGRLPLVDKMMHSPLQMIELSRQLSSVESRELQSEMISALLALLTGGEHRKTKQELAVQTADTVWEALVRSSSMQGLVIEKPEKLSDTDDIYKVLRSLLMVLANAGQAYQQAGGQVTEDELKAIQAQVAVAISSEKPIQEERGLDVDAFHQVGQRVNIEKLSEILIMMLVSVEEMLPVLNHVISHNSPIIWETPLGQVRVTGAGNDHHSGDYLLLIDLGGNDVYEDVGRALAPGSVSIVIDLSGNDVVKWENTAGPGTGVMGIGLWLDMQGDDQYIGRNIGAGAGILGAGMLFDASGNDTYRGGSLVQGVGQYGVGILLDGKGTDKYQAEVSSQGYAGTGGIGVQVDLDGNDHYFCGGYMPDQVVARNERHGAVHYLSLCQGYSQGRRPEISGGIGLLLDHDGNDVYQVDLFGQGGSYWFGLGMLIDKSGSDQYECFEHCQGESLHLGAGLLADWKGNDRYQGFEHSQGVGVDRAVGILYDHAGNDQYHSSHESQGAGIKPFGVGILIDRLGDDYYEADRLAQGYSATPPKGFPDEQWPVGILLDQGGNDYFRLPEVPDIGPSGRIQNRQGIALDTM